MATIAELLKECFDETKGNYMESKRSLIYAAMANAIYTVMKTKIIDPDIKILKCEGCMIFGKGNLSLVVEYGVTTLEAENTGMPFAMYIPNTLKNLRVSGEFDWPEGLQFLKTRPAKNCDLNLSIEENFANIEEEYIKEAAREKRQRATSVLRIAEHLNNIANAINNGTEIDNDDIESLDYLAKRQRALIKLSKIN